MQNLSASHKAAWARVLPWKMTVSTFTWTAMLWYFTVSIGILMKEDITAWTALYTRLNQNKVRNRKAIMYEYADRTRVIETCKHLDCTKYSHGSFCGFSGICCSLWRMPCFTAAVLACRNRGSSKQGVSFLVGREKPVSILGKITIMKFLDGRKKTDVGIFETVANRVTQEWYLYRTETWKRGHSLS